MDGSAAVIGELMVPILEPVSIEAVARARDLGIAFQLTNFLRDVAEDLDRGRVYLPQEDVRKLEAESAFLSRRATPAFRELMAFEIERTRAYYLSGDIGVGLLRGRAQRCVMAARSLYGGILDQIVRDYPPLGRDRRRPVTHQRRPVEVEDLVEGGAVVLPLHQGRGVRRPEGLAVPDPEGLDRADGVEPLGERDREPRGPQGLEEVDVPVEEGHRATSRAAGARGRPARGRWRA